MPKGFQFELQVVLEHRERLERARQGDVARVEAERLAIEARITGIQAAMSAGRKEVRDALAGSVHIGAARLAANASLHDLVKLQRAAIELAGVHQRLGAARRALLKASVDRKAVDTLRAKRLAEYRRALEKREVAELDDLMVMRGGGNRGDEPIGGGDERERAHQPMELLKDELAAAGSGQTQEGDS